MERKMEMSLKKDPGVYCYSSQPRVLRGHYRNKREDCLNNYGNIMFDRRVIRGSTYAQNVLPSICPDPVTFLQRQAAQRRAAARLRATRAAAGDADALPVEGREHRQLQTDEFLVELKDREEEADVACQTDVFLDHPPSPTFVPFKTGVDIATQVYEGELFDFDLELGPVLEVLVGKTVEQSLLEVMEEEELANIREQQRIFEELRDAELAEQQRLEEQERRRQDEKIRRMKQALERSGNEQEALGKIASRAFAQGYLANLIPSVFGSLADAGYFYDPIQRDIERGFLPSLMRKVQANLVTSVVARTVLDGFVRDVVQERSAARDVYFDLDAPLKASIHEMKEGAEEEEEEEEEEALPELTASEASSKSSVR